LIARRLVVIVIALLLAVQVVRNAAVSALATLHPASAAKLWAGHPSVEISTGLADIGRAARERRSIDPRTFAMIDDAAIKSPLASEPFLVRGVQADAAGNADAAKEAFLAAQWRDPRSMPAAYFLANYYFRAGRPLDGLQQTAVLARLSPRGTDAIAPFVAAYAQDRSNWPKMRALFAAQPGMESGVLVALAQDARNADAILAIADQDHRSPDSNWLRILLANLVAGGDYARAKSLWSSVGGGRDGGELVFDSGFSTPGPPPPFNWSLTSSTLGLAERESGNRLHVIFYGNDDGVLASELVTLPAGAYRQQMQLAGGSVHPEALRWSIRCDKSTEPFASIGIDQAAKQAWSFQAPANCPAQWLELSGRSGDVAQQSEVTITGFRLMREAANG
jgi:hypothetical protein